VVVPAYNEAHRLPDGMARFGDAVREGAVDPGTTEVVLVDDGSSDGTADVAARELADLPHHRVVRMAHNGGKGAAVRAGVAVARGRAVAYMDADMSIDPRGVPDLLAMLESHDVAIGSRALPQSMVESTYVLRSVMGQIFNAFVTFGTGLHLRDTQCGCKAFRTPVARLLFGLGSIDRFAFDVELLATAAKLGLRIGEVPVHWAHVQGSTVHPLHDSIPMLRDVYRARLGFGPERAVPALVVVRPGAAPTGPGGEDDGSVANALRAVAPSLPLPSPPPVLEGPAGTAVLLPLADPTEVAACARRLEELLPSLDLPGARCSRRMLPVRALEAFGPLTGRLGGRPSG
jgi:hypothetical protein